MGLERRHWESGLVVEPEARGKLAGGEVQRNHRKLASPMRAPQRVRGNRARGLLAHPPGRWTFGVGFRWFPLAEPRSTTG